MKDKIKKVTNTFMTYEQMYELLEKKNGIFKFNFCLDKDGIWKRLSIKWMFEYFQQKEDYKKCEYLKEILNSDNFIASKKKQKELNKKLKINKSNRLIIKNYIL
jgi:hypothetical protein